VALVELRRLACEDAGQGGTARTDDTTVTPISVAEDLPIIDPMADLSPEVRPWQIQLDDGLVCGARTHGSTTFRETYQCVDPATGSEDEIQSTVSNVDTAASMWTIQQVNAPSLDAIPDRDNPPTRTAQVVTAWSTGSPRALHTRCRPPSVLRTTPMQARSFSTVNDPMSARPGDGVVPPGHRINTK